MQRAKLLLVRMVTVLAAAALGIGILPAWTRAARGAEPELHPIWLVSTRSITSCRPGPEDAERIRYWRMAPDGALTDSDRDAFLAADDPNVPTVMYLPGNRADWCETIRDGWMLYRCLECSAGDRPFRYVIWSWPADEIRGGPRRDVQVKAARSDVESYLMAELVDRIDPEVRLALVGYSFGARIIGGAVEMLEGGEICRMRMESQAGGGPRRIRAVLVAAAIDNFSLLPGRRYGRVLPRLESVLITVNPLDTGLRYYPLMYGKHGPEALGYTGPVCTSRLGPDADKIELVPVACEVGRNHAWDRYIRAPSLRARLGWHCFLEEKPAAVAPK